MLYGNMIEPMPLNDIVAIAKQMVVRFGSQAAAEAKTRATLSSRRGDEQAAPMWARVAKAIRALEREK